MTNLMDNNMPDLIYDKQNMPIKSIVSINSLKPSNTLSSLKPSKPSKPSNPSIYKTPEIVINPLTLKNRHMVRRSML